MRRAQSSRFLASLWLVVALAAALGGAPARRAEADEPLGEEYRDRPTSVAFRPPLGWAKVDVPLEQRGIVRALFQDPGEAASVLKLVQPEELQPTDLKGVVQEFTRTMQSSRPFRVLLDGELKVAGCSAWRLVAETDLDGAKVLNYLAFVERHERAHFVLGLQFKRESAPALMPLFDKVLEKVRVNVVSLEPSEMLSLLRFRSLAARTSGHYNRVKSLERWFGVFFEGKKVGSGTYKAGAGTAEGKDVYQFEGYLRYKTPNRQIDSTWKATLSTDFTYQTFEEKLRQGDGTQEASVETVGIVKEGMLRRRVKFRGRQFDATLPVPPMVLFSRLESLVLPLAGLIWEESLLVPLVSERGEVKLLKVTKGQAEPDGRPVYNVDRGGDLCVLVLDATSGEPAVERRMTDSGAVALELRTMPKEEAEK